MLPDRFHCFGARNGTRAWHLFSLESALLVLLLLIVTFITTKSNAQDETDPISLAWSFFDEGCGIVVRTPVNEFRDLVSSPPFRIESVETTEDKRIVNIRFVKDSNDPPLSVEYSAQWIDHADLEIRHCTMHTTGFEFDEFDVSQRALRDILQVYELEYQLMEYELVHKTHFDVYSVWSEIEAKSKISLIDNASSGGTIYGAPDTSVYFQVSAKIHRSFEDALHQDSD